MRYTINKYKILLAVEILVLVILLPMCFREDTLVYSVTNVSGVMDSDTAVFEGDRFKVRPGIYQVRACTDNLPDGYVYIHAACDESSFRAFRCNGAAIYPDQGEQSFEIYVSEKIDSAYVTLSFNSAKQTIMDSLEVYRLNLGERMLTFLFVLGCILLDSLLVFREWVLSGKVNKDRQIVFWGLLLSVLLAYYPYMTDYFGTAGVTGAYLLRIPALLRIFGFSLMGAYKMLVLMLTVATAVIAYDSFLKCTKHTYAALFGSIVYTLAPNRLDALYKRGAVYECLVLAFLPLAIRGVYGLYIWWKERKKDTAGNVSSGCYWEEKPVKVAGCLLLILAVAFATYQVNDIVYNMEPVWLYNAQNGGAVAGFNDTPAWTVPGELRFYMMLLLEGITLFTLWKMFGELFRDKAAVIAGVLLFMTCPYKIYISYDKASLGMAAAWACIPLVIWGLFRIFHAKSTWKSQMTTAAAFAVVGYADFILMLMLIGVFVLGIIWYRKPFGFVPLAAGMILSVPAWSRWVGYLFGGGIETGNLPLHSIADEGYSFGQFFTFWTYREGHPGLGMALVAAIFILIWLALVEKGQQVMKKYGFFVMLFLLMAFMSMTCFPWDMIQRVSESLLRLVSLMETPGTCFGFASLAACVLGAYGIECAICFWRKNCKHKDTK